MKKWRCAMPGDGKRTVLCIDDEEGMLSALRRVLRPLAYRVVTALSAEEGLSLVHLERPDLIILDVRMPIMDGYQFMARLKEEGKGDIPIVMLTADGTMKDIQKGYQEGSVYYITKPFKNEYVRNIVEYLIGDLSEKQKEWVEQHL
jgi:CheY-like chemotaxis protein